MATDKRFFTDQAGSARRTRLAVVAVAAAVALAAAGCGGGEEPAFESERIDDDLLLTGDEVRRRLHG